MDTLKRVTAIVTETLSQPPKWHTVVCLLLALAVWGLTDVRRRATMDPGRKHRTDLTVFTGAGAAFFDGRDPYAVVSPGSWLYPYPPFFAICMAPLDKLSPPDQAVVWFAFSLLLAWGCWRETRSILQSLQASGALPAKISAGIYWLALATILFPTLNCLQRGQVGILKVYFLLLGFRLVFESRSGWRSFAGGALLAIPVVIKVTPLLPVAFVVFQMFTAAVRTADHRLQYLRAATAASFGVAGGAVLMVLVIPAALLGWQANLDHLGTWYHRVATMAHRIDPTGQVSIPYVGSNQSLTNGVYRLGNWTAYQFADGPDDRVVTELSLIPESGMPMDAAAVGVSLLAVKLLLLGGLLLAAVRLTEDRLGQVMLFGLACAASLILSPLSRTHYFVMLWPACLFSMLWLQQRGIRRAYLAGMVPALLVIAHYSARHITGRIGLLGIGITLWYVAMLYLILRSKPTTQATATTIREEDFPGPGRQAA